MSDVETSIYKSVRVQTVRCSGAGVAEVPMNSLAATHWSLYGRKPDGELVWMHDIAIHENDPPKYYTKAMVSAAQISMDHNIPIEKAH